MLQKSQCFDQSYCCQSRKRNWMDFQAIARLHCFRASREKMLILPTGPLSRFTLSMCPCSIQEFLDRIRITGPLLQRKFDGTWVFCLFFPVILLSFPTVTHLRGNCYLTMTAKQRLANSGLFTANRMLGNIHSFNE